MKKFSLILLFLLFCSKLQAFDEIAFKQAVAMVESNNDQKAVGRRGERSKYQFMRKTWGQYTKYPFNYLGGHLTHLELSVTESVMDAHIEWMEGALKKLGRSNHPFNLALLHNAGYSNLKNSTIPISSYGYAKRVWALYQQYSSGN